MGDSCCRFPSAGAKGTHLLIKDAVTDVLLVGCQSWDDVEKQLNLTCPSNSHPLLLNHVGTNDIATEDLEYRKLYRALYAKVGVQMILSLILKAKGKSGVDNSCK